MNFSRPAVRVLLGLLALAMVAALAAAAWIAHVEFRNDAVAITDPRLAYVTRVREKIQLATDAVYDMGLHQDLRGSLDLHIELDPDGKLVSATIARPSGNAVLDDLALRIVAESAPFEPFPPEVRKNTTVVEITSTFYFR